MLDNLDQKHDVEGLGQFARQLLRDNNARETSLATEAGRGFASRVRREFEPGNECTLKQQWLNQVTATAPEIEYVLAAQTNEFIRPRDDRRPRVRAEERRPIRRGRRVEIPESADTRWGPFELVRYVLVGHASNESTRRTCLIDMQRSFSQMALHRLMLVRHQIFFVSPDTKRPLRQDGDWLVVDGERFPVRGGIPRFVQGAAYVESFGEQWGRYRRVQLDSETAKPLSRERFLAGTGWSRELIADRSVLEIGCGAGRFTQVLLQDGAFVWAIDASSAVDVATANNPSERLTTAQADLFRLPFAESSFERVFCYGVLQHTPDPRAAFLELARYAAPGGLIAMDVYRKLPYIDRWSAKIFWRPLTKRLPRELLRRFVEWYIPRWLPIDTRLARIPKVGRFLVAVIPCWNYTGLLDLSSDELIAWAVLDTFDALSPMYDNPQTVESVQEWCVAADLADVDVRYGGNGILINARKRD